MLALCRGGWEFGRFGQASAAEQRHQPGGRFGRVGDDGEIAVVRREGLARRIELARIARRSDRRVERRVAQMFDQHERRSEEHTSELQSLMRISYAVFCLKKKTHNK